jgi:hypothetical protein
MTGRGHALIQGRIAGVASRTHRGAMSLGGVLPGLTGRVGSTSRAAEVLANMYHNVSFGRTAVVVIVYAVLMYLLVHWIFG